MVLTRASEDIQRQRRVYLRAQSNRNCGATILRVCLHPFHFRKLEEKLSLDAALATPAAATVTRLLLVSFWLLDTIATTTTTASISSPFENVSLALQQQQTAVQRNMPLFEAEKVSSSTFFCIEIPLVFHI